MHSLRREPPHPPPHPTHPTTHPDTLPPAHPLTCMQAVLNSPPMAWQN